MTHHIICYHNRVMLPHHHVVDLNHFHSLLTTWWILKTGMRFVLCTGQFSPVYRTRWRIKFNQSWALVALTLMEINKTRTQQMLHARTNLQPVKRVQRSARKQANISWLAKSWPSRKSFGQRIALVKRSVLAALTWWYILAVRRFIVKFHVVWWHDVKHIWLIVLAIW